MIEYLLVLDRTICSIRTVVEKVTLDWAVEARTAFASTIDCRN